MSDMGSQNPYYEHYKNDFLECVKKKDEMEKDFKPENSEAYIQNKSNIIKNAIELLKIDGITAVKEDNVQFIVDNIEYEFPLHLFKDNMEKNDYTLMFGKYDKKIEPETRKAMFTTTSSEDEVVNNENMYGGYNMNSANIPQMPFYGFYPPQFMPSQPPSNPEATSTILKELSQISMQLTAIEKGKEEDAEQLKKDYSELKKKYDELKDDYDNLSRKKDKISDQHEVALSNISAMEASLSERGTEFKVIENKYKSSLSEVNDKDYQIADLKKDLSIANDQAKELRSKVSSLEIQLDNSESRNKRFEQQVNDLKNEIKNKKDALSSLTAQNDADIKEQVKKATEEELNKLNEERKIFENEKVSLLEKISQLEAALNTPGNEDDKAVIEELKTEISKLKVERDNSRKDADNLKTEKDSLERDRAYNIKRFEDLKYKSNELEQLAYIDTHTGVKNLNAYKKEFYEFNLNSMILALVSINGLKNINDTWGRKSGDKMILEVANELKDGFKDASIYRIFGDQFIVVALDTTLNSVEGQLVDITRKLACDDIDISFGTAVGNSCKSHNEVSNVADDNLKRKKNMSSNITEEQQKMYNSLHQSISPVQKKVEDVKENEPEEIDMDEEILDFMNQN